MCLSAVPGTYSYMAYVIATQVYSMKARIMVTDGDSFALPTLTELDLSNTGWGIEDLEIIQEHFYEIMIRRKYKFIFERFKQDAALDNLRNLCYKLENELKSIF
jgi:hypothetical protein